MLCVLTDAGAAMLAMERRRVFRRKTDDLRNSTVRLVHLQMRYAILFSTQGGERLWIRRELENLFRLCAKKKS